MVVVLTSTLVHLVRRNNYFDALELLDVRVSGRCHRTGTGTKAVFARQYRHNLADGFPLLTTKKLHFKSIANELIWLLLLPEK